ncbi:ARP2/3 complex 20 kDa subunit (ARPC4) protein, partial [Helicosporidium sp. ATCC 50920]
MPVPPTDPLKDYLTALEPAIRTSLCLQPFPSQYVERHDRPVIECEPESSHLRSPPITIRRSEQEACLIEPSINSTRISFRFKTTDSLERYILDSYRRFMLRRAEDLEILRRIAILDYDVTFLITYGHLTRYSADGLTAFIIQ